MEISIKKKKNFTVIELLVVFSLLALVATIVLISIRSTREQSKDARIIESMDFFRKRANLVYQSDTHYDNICCGLSHCDSEIDKICKEVDFWNGNYPGIAIYKSNSPSQEYCAEVQLNSNKWYCVDSELNAFATNSDPICASGSYKCK